MTEPVLVGLPAIREVAVVHSRSTTTYALPSSGDDGERAWMEALAVSSTGERVAWGESAAVGSIDLPSGRPQPVAGQPPPMLLAYRGANLVSVSATGSMAIDGRLIPPPPPSTGVRALRSNTDPDELLATFDDGSVQTLVDSGWDGPITWVTGAATSITFGEVADPHETAIAVGTTAGTVELHTADGESVLTTGVDGPVRAVEFASGDWLVAACGSQLVRFGVGGAGEVVARHPATVTGLAALRPRDESSQLDWVVTSSEDGWLRVWDIPTGTLVGAAAANVGFVALASGNRTVAARTAEGDLWILRASLPATATDELSFRLDRTERRLALELRLRSEVDVELRAVQIMRRREPKPARPRQLEIDGQFVTFGTDGRLAAPRRCRSGHETVVTVHSGRAAGEDGLVLTMWHPSWVVEREIEFPGGMEDER